MSVERELRCGKALNISTSDRVNTTVLHVVMFGKYLPPVTVIVSINTVDVESSPFAPVTRQACSQSGLNLSSSTM
jgi:tRNA pseudouridine-54 N-methylase